MAKKLTTLNSYYENYLILKIRGYREWDTLGKSITKHVRPLYNRIMSNPVTDLIAAEDNSFAMANFAQHISRGEYLAAPNILLWFILDQYGDEYQINLERLEQDTPYFRMHRDWIAAVLRGCTANHPELLTFWDTNGVNAITIKASRQRKTACKNTKANTEGTTIDATEDNTMELKEFKPNNLYWCDLRIRNRLDDDIDKWVRTAAQVVKKTTKSLFLDFPEYPTLNGYRIRYYIEPMYDSEEVCVINLRMNAYNPVQ